MIWRVRASFATRIHLAGHSAVWKLNKDCASTPTHTRGELASKVIIHSCHCSEVLTKSIDRNGSREGACRDIVDEDDEDQGKTLATLLSLHTKLLCPDACNIRGAHPVRMYATRSSLLQAQLLAEHVWILSTKERKRNNGLPFDKKHIRTSRCAFFLLPPFSLTGKEEGENSGSERARPDGCSSSRHRRQSMAPQLRPQTAGRSHTASHSLNSSLFR